MRQILSSLAFRIGASVVLVEVIILLGIGFYAAHRLTEEIERRTEERIVLPGEMMGRGVLSYDSVSDAALMKNLIGQDLEEGMVVGVNGNIFHSTNPEYLGRDIWDVPGMDRSWIDNHRVKPAVIEVERSGRVSLIAVTPLFVRGADIPTLFTLLKVDTTALDQSKRQLIMVVAGISLLCIVLTSAIIFAMFQVTTLKRLQGLAVFVRRIGAGEKNVAALAVGTDELGRLESGVNRMAADLEQRASQRDRAEADLRESESRFRDFATSASDWYWELDEDLRFVSLSDRFFELRQPERSPLGQAVDRMGVEPVEEGGWTPLFERMREREPVTDFDVWWEDAAAPESGGRRFARLSGVPVFEAGGTFKGYRGTGRDTTLQHQARQMLERRVAERTAELTQTNGELQQTLENLHRAQAELVRSEKLASLGALVAGVAHEINTPVGVALTAASHLGDRTRDLRDLLSGGTIKRADLGLYIDTAEEATRLLVNNMQRADRLIQSFKQVAADRTSDPLRSFDLKGYLEDIVNSLSPVLRGKPHQLRLDCPEGVEMVSYPGLLSQVVGNFVMNSLAHAYDEGQTGQLTLSVDANGDGPVRLVYGDDGRGIATAIQPRVFDPFFTTQRGAGFTGLGLNIVHNIVTGTLRGQIALDSAPGEGTRFILTLPRRLAESEAGMDAHVPAFS